MGIFDNLFGKEKKVNYVKKEIAEKYFKLFSLFYEKDGTSDAEYLLKRMLQSPRDYYKDNDFALEMDGIKEDENISSAIAINEAVELAKRYGQEKSPEFINGVLAKFA